MKKLSLLLICANLGACSLRGLKQPTAAVKPVATAAVEQAGVVEVDDSTDYHNVSLPVPKLVVTKEVQREIFHFLKIDRKFIEESLKRRAEYLPEMEDIFEEEGVPHELMNVALIESGFKPNARSGAGAVGMWQFMKTTAQLYGLKIGRTSDQRKDPILSSRAAARHLRDLYLRYKDWYLALAAYNAGCGRIGRAIDKAGVADFWELARRSKILPNETARFVPKFIATALIVSNPEQYGFDVPSDDEIRLAYNNGPRNAKDNRVADATIADWTRNRRTSAS